MRRAAVIILACACTALAEIYVTSKGPPLYWGNITRSEIVYPPHQSSQFSAPLWTNISRGNVNKFDSSNQEGSSWESNGDGDLSILPYSSTNAEYPSSIIPQRLPVRPRPYDPSQLYPKTPFNPNKNLEVPTNQDPDSFLYPNNSPDQYPVSQESSAENDFGFQNPPSFLQALKDLDLVGKEIQSHIDPSAGLTTKRVSQDRLDERKLYLVQLGVIGGMMHGTARVPWKYYDKDYDIRARGLLKYTPHHTVEIEGQWVCNQNYAFQYTYMVRDVIENKWVKRVCRISAKVCDLVIMAVIDVGDDDLKEKSQMLLALGKLSALFLDRYAQKLATVATSSRSNVYHFLKNGKDYLKPLVQAGREVVKLLPPGYPCSFDENPIK